MKTQLVALAFGALAAGSAAAQVGVSIGVNQPGVYGRIDIGQPLPPPALVQPRPILVAPGPVGYAPPAPLYIYVPTAYQHDWRRYCRRYDACGRPVYFVREDWVRERYVREHPGWERDRPPGWDHGRKRGWDRDRDESRHERGHGERDGGPREEGHRGDDRREGGPR